jgi:hypothetical protein
VATGASDATAAASGGKAASTAKTSAGGEGGQNADAVAKKNGVKLAPKDVKPGDKCEKGAVGCSDGGTFTGDYFK